MARTDGSPKDVDHEIFSVFTVLDQNQSPYHKRNVCRYARDPAFVDGNCSGAAVLGGEPVAVGGE
jgi:hypothetical protein